MKRYNFDKIIDRRGTCAIKYDLLKEIFGKDNLIPLWVADMDFSTPDFIIKALEKRLNHPIYGYSLAPESYWNSIINWEDRIHGWKFTRNELTFIPGIVKGIGMVLQCFTRPGDNVIIQPPVYYPFKNVPLANGREIIYNPLIYSMGNYEMDFDQLEACMINSPKVLILSNPHNPAGRVWSKETLSKLADICAANNVLVISDEIHADMALYDNKHIPFASVSEIAAKICITFASPSKTFNIAGLVSSFAVVYNKEIRDIFYKYLDANEFNSPTFISTVATEAAYTCGDLWRRQMLKYVEENVDFVSDYIGVNIPRIVVIKPQASFLVWLDCSGLAISDEELKDLFINKAGLALNAGADFGPGGEGFMRMNVGCPRSILAKALKQLKDALNR